MSITLSALQQQRRDTAANWTSANPTLLAGELGYETDTGRWKIGTGSTAWTALGYTPWSQISYPIVNADVSATAEIAVSKLANGTANQVLVTDGTDVSWSDDLTIAGNLTVSGTTTTVNTETVTVEDKNIELGVVGTPTDVTANGGGITLKSGSGDKTITWQSATGAWTFSEDINLSAGKQYKIQNTVVLNATTLGSNVVTSSLTAVGTLTTGIWNATTIAVGNGGTGQTSYTDGQLLIGNSTGNTLAKATLTAGSNVTITNGSGSIQIASANTEYTAGDGLDLTGTTFSTDLKANGGLAIESAELAVDLGASSITGTLGVSDGGTGQTAFTDGELLIGKTDGTLAKATLTAGSGATITNADGAITIAAAGTGLPSTGGTLTGDLTLGNQADLRFGEATANGSNFVAFQAPASIGSDVTWTLPDADAAVSGYALVSNGSGVLSWSAAGGGATGGGTDAIFQENGTTVTTSYTVGTTFGNTAACNAMSAGPITVNAAATVTVSAGSSWTVI